MNLNQHIYSSPQIKEPMVFSLSMFLCRYLAGNTCLREARQVSRKDLAIVSCGLISSNPIAVHLHKTLVEFGKTVKKTYDSPFIDEEKICQVNHSLSSDFTAGQIRTTSSFIGADMQNVTLHNPEPEQLPALMESLLEHIKQTHSISDAWIVHQKILQAHFFHDGNGRTARAILQALLFKINSTSILPDIFRLTVSQAEYIHQMKSLTPGKEDLRHRYWERAKVWINSYEQNANIILSTAKKRITQQYLLQVASPTQHKLVKLLWLQPVVTINYLSKVITSNLIDLQQAISNLLSLKILTEQRISTQPNISVYVCQDVLDTWQQLDQLITQQHKER